MSGADRSRDDPCRHSPFAAGGLNARLQSMLLAVLLPAAVAPADLHVDQDALMEGGELFSLLSGDGVSGGPGGVWGEEWGRGCGLFEHEPLHRDLHAFKRSEPF